VSGLALLSPAGLLALLALLLPLAIHLFSRSRGRRVLVGNIALYRQTRQQRVFEPRLLQRLLLLLRLLLLALAALLLAGLARPALQTLPGTTAYVTPAWLAAQARDLSALASFDQRYLLAPGYPALDSADARGAVADADAWSLLAERLRSVRHAGEVHLYAVAAAAQFAAQAPPLPVALHWHLSESGDQAAAAPPALEVTLLHDAARRTDAELLAQALQLVATHRRVDLVLRRVEGETVAALGSWASPEPARSARRALIWLSTDAVTDALPGDLPVDVLLADSAPAAGPALPAQLPRAPQLRFFARPSPAASGEVLWRAENGAPLLVASERGQLRLLRYLDRLHAGREGLLGQAQFPDALLRLLLGETLWREGSARAPADPAPATARPGAVDTPPVRGLADWLALAMALLFAAERWLSERPRPEAVT
jgi:hypothetical protein